MADRKFRDRCAEAYRRFRGAWAIFIAVGNLPVSIDDSLELEEHAISDRCTQVDPAAREKDDRTGGRTGHADAPKSIAR